MKFLIIFLVLFSLPVLAKTEIFIKCVSLDNYLTEYYRYIEEETELPKFYVYDSKNIDIHEITQWAAIVSYDKKNKIIKGTRFWDDPFNEGIEKFKIDLSKGFYLTDFNDLLTQVSSLDQASVLRTIFFSSDVGKVYLLLSRALGREVVTD